VLAAAVWVGGSIALVFVAVPVARTLVGDERASVLRELGRRWKPLGWSALAVLVLTGFRVAAGEGFFAGGASAGFTAVLSVKLGLVVVLACFAFAHDFVLGPRLARQIREQRAQTARQPLVVVGWTTLALTLVVPVLGVVLSRLDG
jgi:uncharacterized membrane protein